MPMYEYRCEPCDHSFETLVRSASDTPVCPRCRGSERLHKQFSVPAAARATGAGASAGLPMCQPGPSPMPMMGGCGGGGCGSGMCGL